MYGNDGNASHLLSSRAIPAIICGINYAQNLIRLLRRRLRVHRRGILNVVPVFIARCREKSLLQSQNLGCASGDDASHDEFAIGGEEVCEFRC